MKNKFFPFFFSFLLFYSFLPIQAQAGFTSDAECFDAFGVPTAKNSACAQGYYEGGDICYKLADGTINCNLTKCCIDEEKGNKNDLTKKCQTEMGGTYITGNICSTGDDEKGTLKDPKNPTYTYKCCKKNYTTPSSDSSFDYTPLEPIPGATNDTSTLAGFLEGLYFFVMWSAGVMAMFMIGLGGFWYLTSAGNTSRVGEAKTIIVNALLGLLVLTFTWLILYIINPDLTKLDWSSLEEIAVDVGSETGTGNKSTIDTPTTVGCGKIVEAAHAMVTSGCKYSQAKRNACTGNPGYTDCSDFTYHAYKKAGCSTGFGNTTATMVGKTPTFNGDQSSLKAGDALVYNNGGSGHVVICEQDGCNTITHASGEKAGLKKGASSGYIFKKPNLHVIRAETFCANAKDASC
ncbi:MAG: hypothetical protein IPN70_02595 [Candidatus Moraniibacteriota bacterium]|nr:MAG: hypothetical protein IPN70_02595 [Candidatus Moranbacteria bacterium]